MREATGDLWTYPADIRVITTNGSVKKNGEAVMGRGCAKEAAERNRVLPAYFGRELRKHGNVALHLFHDLYTLPVKHEWWEEADPKLIVKSVRRLRRLIDELDEYDEFTTTVVMPRPGCGAGNLNWSDVKPLIEPYLDDRFTVITYGKGRG